MEEQVNKKIVDISTLAYDLTAITDFIFQSNTKDKISEIKELYSVSPNEGLQLIQKEMAESKSEDMNAAASLRYDLIRHLMDRVDDIIMDEYDDLEDMDEDIDISSPILTKLGDTFALNTLLYEGMLVNMNLNDLKDGKQ